MRKRTLFYLLVNFIINIVPIDQKCLPLHREWNFNWNYAKVMLKKITYLLGIALFLTSCGKDFSYRIEGKITDMEDKVVYVVFEGDGNKEVDTLTCEKPGHFSIETQNEGYNTATLFFENKSHWVTVYLEPKETFTVSGSIKEPLLLKVKGGKINNELTHFKEKQEDLFKELNALSLSLRLNEANSSEQTDITARLANVNLQLSENAVQYIKDHPDAASSVVLIQNFFSDPDDTRKIDELLALLDPKLKSFYLYAELEQYSARAKRTALGAEAPDFAVRNIYGKPVALDSFPQAYTLLTFTAPWCDQCHIQDLALDKVIRKYPKDKLGILLVTLDTNSDELRSQLVKDSIAWNIVTDSAGQAIRLIDLYNVNVLPRCFLIDENHKIILKTENDLELEQALENIFEEE